MRACHPAFSPTYVSYSRVKRSPSMNMIRHLAKLWRVPLPACLLQFCTAACIRLLVRHPKSRICRLPIWISTRLLLHVLSLSSRNESRKSDTGTTSCHVGLCILDPTPPRRSTVSVTCRIAVFVIPCTRTSVIRRCSIRFPFCYMAAIRALPRPLPAARPFPRSLCRSSSLPVRQVRGWMDRHCSKSRTRE